MNVPKCDKTISGEHIWNTGDAWGIDVINIELKRNDAHIELVRCRACGLVDDRAPIEPEPPKK